jgi:hypothetical protein
MTETIQITVEGKPARVDDREYSGTELRTLGGLANHDKLVREEADGSETPIPPTKHVQVHHGENYFKSVRHRRG